MSEEIIDLDMNDDDPQDLVELTEEMSLLQEIRDDMDKMIPALRAAIARDSSFEAMDTRLKKLEAERSSFSQWKMAADIHKFRVRMLHTSMPKDLKESINEEITKILDNQGFKKFGEVGEPFNELHHRVVDMKDDRGNQALVKLRFEAKFFGQKVHNASSTSSFPAHRMPWCRSRSRPY